MCLVAWSYFHELKGTRSGTKGNRDNLTLSLQLHSARFSIRFLDDVYNFAKIKKTFLFSFSRADELKKNAQMHQTVLAVILQIWHSRRSKWSFGQNIFYFKKESEETKIRD